jgi:hypothetical protein
VFVWTWTRTSLHRPDAPTIRQQTHAHIQQIQETTLPAKPPQPPIPSERISFFINARINSLMLDLDLTPISRISLHIDNVVANLCPGSGRYASLIIDAWKLTPYTAWKIHHE